MVQHILLMLVAAPLIALSAPITLLLRRVDRTRRAGAGSCRSCTRGSCARLSFPVVGWVLFAAVMWVAHFSPLFNAALEDPFIHDLEHVLFLERRAALLVAGRRRSTRRRGGWATRCRIGHLFMEMTQNTFLAVVILNVGTVLYAHYATVVRDWGPTPLDDQRLAAGVMWVAGDLVFIAAIMAVVAGWVRFEARDVEARRTARRPRRWPPSASASGRWPSGWPTSAASRGPDPGLSRAAGSGRPGTRDSGRGRRCRR